MARVPWVAWLEIDKERLRPLRYLMEHTRRTAVVSQDGLARNKCRSGLASRCAARAALDLIGAEFVVANTCQPSCNPKATTHCFMPNSASSISALAMALR